MASRLNPYLSFPGGNARQAMEFYRQVFGGTLTLSSFGEFGHADTDFADKIMHSMLVADSGFVLMGADVPPGMEHTPGHTVTVSLSGDDADELRGYWQQLAQGATVSTPLAQQAWGDEFGACVDRFGISWMVDIAPRRH